MASGVFGQSEGAAQKLSVVNVRATRLNFKEAHEVTHGHNAYNSKNTVTKKDAIIMEWSPPFHKLQ